MHWKERHCRLYLYRSVRYGCRVRSECVGTEEAAALLDQLDSAPHLTAKLDRQRDRAHRRFLAAVRSLPSVRKLVSVHIDLQGAFREDPLEAGRFSRACT